MISLDDLGIKNAKINYQLSPEQLHKITLEKGQGVESSTGALAVNTGKFTGRSPQDRFIVKDSITEDKVWWGNVNIPFDSDKFEKLLNKVTAYLSDKEIYVRDSYVCSEDKYRMNVRVVTEYAWSNLFCYNMFLRPSVAELESFEPNFTIICIPEFEADPKTDGTRQKNFTILNLTKKTILIGGTAYAGEIKKGIFSVLNYTLPKEHNVLSMHCSANIGRNGDAAIFFGLSGTGKTTLSTDPERKLIGDDEHGWSEKSVFNFEGGCYAKVIDLDETDEPEIWRAITFGSIVENVRFHQNTRRIDFANREVTVNTRTAYPIHFIPNAIEPSVGDTPKDIFFLTADAFGIFPPISKLNANQAMYHFISGYTAKVAGTEMGVSEPEATFSACFGEAFLPLHPTKYASIFGEKMKQQDVRVWLINTGWTGGPYGTGSRIKLKYTRAMIAAILEGELDNKEFKTDPIFGLRMPESCPNVPDELLDPINTWERRGDYVQKAIQLANSFHLNFEKFSQEASPEMLDGGPLVDEHYKLKDYF